MNGNRPALTNKRGEEILLFQIDRFLINYPAYAAIMANAVVFFSEEAPRINPTKLQRRYFIGYNAADAMLTSLRAAKVVLHFHEPRRDELSIDKDQAKLLADYILKRKQS